MLVHDPEVDRFRVLDVPGQAHALLAGRIVDHGVVASPAIVDEVLLDGAPEHDGLEVVHALTLPARPEGVGESVIGGAVTPLPDGGGRALKDVDLLGRFGQWRQHLNA